MMKSMSRRRFLKLAGAGSGGTILAAWPHRLLAGTPATTPTSKTKLTFAWPFALTSQTFQEELAKRFMEQHRSIEVEVQIIPQTQAVAKLTAAFSAGAAPDCMAMSDSWFTRFAAGGYLESLEPQLKSSGLDKDILAPMMETARLYKNTAYMAGFLVDVYCLYYNKQLFRDAGLSNPPKDVDEFASDAKKITDVSKNRYGYYALGGSGWQLQQWSTWMFNHGGLGANNGFFDASQKCILNGPKHVAGLERWLALYQKDKVSPEASATASFTDASNAFNAGQIGMVLGWLGYIGTLSGGIGPDKFGVAATPAGPAGQFFYSGGNGYSITKESKNKEAAWEYVRFLLSPEINALLNKTWGAIPANAKALKEPWLDGPHFQAPKAMIQNERSLIKWPRHLPDYGPLQLVYAPEQIQKAMLGQQTAQQFADNVANFLNTAVTKAL